MFREGQVEQDGGTSAVQGGGASHEEQVERLHRRLKKLVKARGALDLAEAEALREAQRLMVWRRFGYGGLLEYMEMEMGYPPRAAIERLRVANAIVDLPQMAAALEQGELSFSAARELTRVATPETEAEWLGATCELNLRDVEAAVSGHKRGDRPTDEPDPTSKRKVLRLEVAPEMVALWRQVQRAIEKEKGERVDDSTVVDVLGRMYLSERAQTARDVAPYQIAVTLCERCQRGWQDGAGIVVEMSPASVERAKCHATHVARVDAEPRSVRGAVDSEPGGVRGVDVDGRVHAGDTGARRVGSRDTEPGIVGAGVASDSRTASNASSLPGWPRTSITAAPAPATKSEPPTAQPKRKIPARIRKAVNRRDHRRCQVPWCRSSRNCDIHHLDPWAQGGTHTLENLITLCEAHHLAHHEGALTVRFEKGRFVIERVESSDAIRDERASDTALALRGLGFKPNEVKQAVERTRTHVGKTDVPLQQWVAMALGYCPGARTDPPKPS